MNQLIVISAIAACGMIGGFVNVFIGDSGLHLPRMENGFWQPGYLGVVFLGMVAALASWASLNSLVLFGSGAQSLALSTGDVANAIMVGFGSAKWWKSESEKDVLQKTAAVAAGKQPNPTAAQTIATG